MSDPAASIAPTDDGYELPVTELLTGRGAIFGKSGSGKSNTVTVVLEELLERELSFLVVDSDGEYFGLKEEYEVVRAGADAECDLQVGPDDADALAALALERGVPVLLDLSGYLDSDVADALVKGVLERLFHRERDRRQPFLVVLEEVHEYIPQSGGTDDLAETVVRVAKRGRKRGLGVLGVSQRPAAVDKNFITQCNWLVWHRLTWNNDVQVVGSHLGAEYADRVERLDAGDAFLMCDWEESVTDVSFRLKRTFDAGATPGFEEFSPPPLVSVRESVLDAFRSTQSGDLADAADDGAARTTTLPNFAADDRRSRSSANERAGGTDDESAEGAGDETSGTGDGETTDAEADSATEGEWAAEPDANRVGDAGAEAGDGARADDVAVERVSGERANGTVADVPARATPVTVEGAGRSSPAQPAKPSGPAPAPERDDLVWETGQLVAYLVERTGQLLRWTVGRLHASTVAGARGLHARTRRALRPVFGEWTRVAEGLLVVLCIVVVSLALLAL